MYVPVKAYWHTHIQGKLIIGKLWKVPCCTLETGGNGVHQKNMKFHFSEGKTVKMHSWTFISNTMSRLAATDKGSWNHTVFQENQSWFLMHFHYSQMHYPVFTCTSHIELLSQHTAWLPMELYTDHMHAGGPPKHCTGAMYVPTYMCRSNSVLLSSYLRTYLHREVTEDVWACRDCRKWWSDEGGATVGGLGVQLCGWKLGSKFG